MIDVGLLAAYVTLTEALVLTGGFANRRLRGALAAWSDDLRVADKSVSRERVRSGLLRHLKPLGLGRAEHLLLDEVNAVAEDIDQAVRTARSQLRPVDLGDEKVVPYATALFYTSCSLGRRLERTGSFDRFGLMERSGRILGPHRWLFPLERLSKEVLKHLPVRLVYSRRFLRRSVCCLDRSVGALGRQDHPEIRLGWRLVDVAQVKSGCGPSDWPWISPLPGDPFSVVVQATFEREIALPGKVADKKWGERDVVVKCSPQLYLRLLGALTADYVDCRLEMEGESRLLSRGLGLLLTKPR